MGADSRALVLATASLTLIALGMRASVYWPFTVDDTFITLRYAKHLAEGLGPAWNPGGAPVEGYTTALWMALLALPHAWGLDALQFAKLTGVACAYASVLVAALLARELACLGGETALGRFAPRDRERAGRLAALAPFALATAYWPLALHATSGMETALSALLLTTFVLVSVRFARAPTRLRARSLSLLALFCTLARPEAGLACGAALLVELALVPKAQRAALLRALALYLLLPGGLYFALRYAHFGLLFPLSFYVKARGQPRLAGLEEVRLFFEPFVAQRPMLALLALWGAAGARGFWPGLCGLAVFALFFLFPAHIMGFEGRYLFPLFPSLSALIGAGFGKLGARVFELGHGRSERAPLALAEPGANASRSWPRAGYAELALAFAGWALLASVPLPAHEASARARWLAYGAGLSRAHVAFANELRKARPAVLRPTVALLDVGAVAYYSEWFTIDTYGLNDARVALSRRSDVGYVFSHRPELLVVVSAEPGRYVEVFDWEAPLYAEARARGYQPLCSHRFLDDYHLLVLARPNSPLRSALRCSIG